MAKNSIRDYSATNSSNTDIQSIDISEGCSPAGINNAIREVMADLKDVSTGAVALESPAADSLSVTGDLTVDTNTLYVDSTNNRVGIGITSPSAVLDVKSSGATSTAFRVLRSSTNTNLHAMTEISGHGRLSVYDGSENEDIRLDSNGDSYFNGGNVAINTTSPNTSYQTTIQSNSTKGALSIDGPATNGYWAAEVDMPSGSTYGILFKNAGSNVGNIRINASSTSYNTSSDYRLKTAVTYDWDATTRLKQLKPARFEWIADGDDAVPVDGFLAHEVEGIVPEAISGTHNEVDDEGNPVYQGIDQSKLVPLLVKTIQELEARITALEAN